MARGRQINGSKDSDEGAFGYARMIPWQDPNQDCHCSDIQEKQHSEREPHRFCNVVSRARLARCDRNELDPAKCVNSKRHREQWRQITARKKSTVDDILRCHFVCNETSTTENDER